MNILHHKSWHVRNKDNIARVRRDEAKAAEEAKKKEEQISRAEREARISFLRGQNVETNAITVSTEQQIDYTNIPSTSEIQGDGHLNLFTVKYTQSKTNKEHEKEIKEEKEKYEKKIGYLTYLGQYQNEDPHLKRWYDIEPKRFDPNSNFSDEDVKDADKKAKQDPMKIFVTAKKNYKEEVVEKIDPNKSIEEMLLKSIAKKSKKEKKIKKEKNKSKSKKKSKDKHKDKKKEKRLKAEKILELREQRLKREAAEKLRQEILLKKYNKA